MSKSVIYEDDDFSIIGEIHEDLIFVHCTCYNYSKTILKRIREVFKEFKSVVWDIGECCLFSVTDNLKFLNKVDPSYRVIDGNEHKKVVVWDLTLSQQV